MQPGEICITATLLEQAEQVPGIYLESLGAHKLKNIRQPVQVYRVTLADSIEADALDVRTSAQLSAKEVWGRQPSIAVLPLGYVGGDAGDAYFAEDIVEGVVALLTDLKELVVIWRSKAANVGRYLEAPEFGAALGVHYVLRGCVRRSMTTVRVTSELCDAENGATIRADTIEVLLGERSTGSVVLLNVLWRRLCRIYARKNSAVLCAGARLSLPLTNSRCRLLPIGQSTQGTLTWSAVGFRIRLKRVDNPHDASV